ncbi:dTDP-4-dehydrorhamnose 3,5-epimerase [Kosakonia sacchari]|uniref:dTDP-4-dehydrorhamnose 3,5-epimerase n=1 Tax=Kosakonia sacchari TaxID=1158459 RepID=A0ABZ0MU73_9ENTR|nr:dTDP-4-dehydrorhamnose 3,5-epimerase [Kosakonia sacchari]WOZ78995.1 dTDP-4-dehydrorhamnose 3,5-epimerase [Kosakonia sacchari]
MKVIETEIKGLLIFEPKVFEDERGFFFESFNQRIFNNAVGYEVEFVQDNHSLSGKNVLRGLHFQLEPYAQGKLVRCISGAVYDVAVDIRPSSESFGKWVGVELSAKNKKQFWIPPGFAHGFLTLCDKTEFVYKATNFYRPESERSLIWNDESLNIEWPTIEESPTVSAKDSAAQTLKELFS